MDDLPHGTRETIAAIHAHPLRISYAFSGAGSQALAWLHGVAGSSNTLLEANDPYAPAALGRTIGFAPEPSVSEAVAGALAERSFQRAIALAEPGTPVAGLGCTAAIATDRAKRGAHRACVAVRDPWEMRTYALTLQKGVRSREQEEALVSSLVLRALAQACDVEGPQAWELREGERLIANVESHDRLPDLFEGHVEVVSLSPAGTIASLKTKRGVALLSGAFNPLHDGHRALARVAARRTGLSAHFELPVVNADKRPIELAEARRRALQFLGVGPVLFTRAPLFAQKAALFPESVFVVGADTAERLIETRFYDDDPARVRAAFAAVREAGCRFLVAGRQTQKAFQTLEDLPIPSEYADLFEGISEHDFRVDLSSTALREGHA